MYYEDALYGSIQLPCFAQRLSQTPQMQRLRGISQDVLPQQLLPWPMASRLEHSLGTCHLATLAFDEHEYTSKPAMLFMISALLHDTGNPCLSHLAEPFLKKLTGLDGESFLYATLLSTPAEKIINHLGFQLEEVAACVTGKLEPLSIGLNGSLDIDNVDNIGRYLHCVGKVPKFDAPKIASGMRFDGKQWRLKADRVPEAKSWQQDRQDVYANHIYSEPHLGTAMMLYRGLQLAFDQGKIRQDFFWLDDLRAFHRLAEMSDNTSHLARLTREKQWHALVVDQKTERPSRRLKTLAANPDSRKNLADAICTTLNLPLWAIAVYIGRGRDRRHIELPLDDESQMAAGKPLKPIYRLKVYVAQEFARTKLQRIREITNEFIKG